MITSVMGIWNRFFGFSDTNKLIIPTKEEISWYGATSFYVYDLKDQLEEFVKRISDNKHEVKSRFNRNSKCVDLYLEGDNPCVIAQIWARGEMGCYPREVILKQYQPFSDSTKNLFQKLTRINNIQFILEIKSW